MTTTPFSPAGADAATPTNAPSDERGRRSRDRVLLYLRGMDLSPLESVDLARESLSRSGPDADPAGAMREVRDLLAERGLTHSAQNSRGERVLSAPPMNRRPMIAEELTPRRRLTSLFDRLRRRGRSAPTVQIRPAPEGDRHG